MNSDRILAALGALACLALLGVAAWLHADPHGHGTHEQLGMPACGWVLAFNKPCPTCGMTTAFAHASDGHLLAAARAQPAGAIFALGVAAAFWTLLHAAVFGSRISRVFRPLWTTRWISVAGVGVLLAWVYKLATWPS